MTSSIEQANKHHPTTKFTAEISELVIVYKDKRFERESLLDVGTHFKAMEAYTQALGLLRTNSSKTSFEERVRALQKYTNIARNPGQNGGQACALHATMAPERHKKCMGKYSFSIITMS